MKTSKLLPVVLIMSACASSQPEPVVTAAPTPQPMVAAQPVVTKGVEPAGSYEIATVVDGQTVTGTIVISGTTGAYTGKIVTNAFPEIPIVGAVAEGQGLIVRGNLPNGELTLNMKFEGADYKGIWTMGGDSGPIVGKKLPK